MASRDNFDLFTKWGRDNFFRSGLVGDNHSRHYAKIDTFGHYICAVVGHGDVWESQEEEIIICLRCGKRVVAQEEY